jgi:hypothetical protein
MTADGLAGQQGAARSALHLERDARLSSSKLIDLRNLLAERFPHSFLPTAGRLKTNIRILDHATKGGLPKNAITEISSPHISAGSASLIHALLQTAHRERYFLALIDGRDSFDPESIGNLPLRNLLWIRCQNAVEAVKAADLLLRDGNFPLVILDLVLNTADELRKIPHTSWYRLQRLVEPVVTAFLVLTRRSTVSSAQWKLTLDNSWTLNHLDRRDVVSELKIRVQRIHGAGQIAEVQ